MLAELALAAVLGREIYHHGKGASEITAVMGETRVPAAAVVCASCHGADGRGRAEGGVTPADVRYAMLTKPYEVAAQGGRTRKPYDDRLIRRAITMGIDSSGNRLSDVMPRYQMTREDLDALMAYLRTLGDEIVPGVTATTIRAGVLLPPPPRDASVRHEIERWVQKFNDSGGVYGRTIEVVFNPTDEVFAYFASFTDGVPKPAGVPLLSAFDNDPDLTAPNARYLFAGITQQARALAHYAAERKMPVAIDPAIARFFETTVVNANTPDALHLHLASHGGAAAFDAKGVEHAVAFPTLVTQHIHESAALASAEIFATALRAAGGDLTRERFLQAVDAIHALDTAHGPVTYRGNRRIGLGGAWILPIARDGTEGKPQFVRVGD